jgi:hypothetical protein
MKRFVTRLWQTDPILTGTGLFMLLVAVPSALGVWLDPRVITGAPAWLKPLKFALSTGIYSLTIAWLFTFLPEWTRTRAIVGPLTAAVMILEVGIIDLQAWRGTTSHFNFTTPFDGALFGVMGTAIVVQTLASIAVAVALCRQSFADRALGWALRLGMILTIAGAFSGGLMTRPTGSQLDAAKVTHSLPISGAHTVGGPDGGAGLPVIGWSRTHGDLRVPHFLGLHAVQVLPILALLLRRRFSEKTRVRLAMASAAFYSLLFAGLLVQALSGLPLLPVA